MPEAQVQDGHDVLFDVASAGYPRLTCKSCDPGALTFVTRQPFMSDAKWELEYEQFLKDHPPAKGRAVNDDPGVPRSMTLERLRK